MTLKVEFPNPSNITIHVGNLNFESLWNEKNANIGAVFIDDMTIVPGNNTFTAIMHLMTPQNKELANMMVSNYMTQAQVPLTILGTKNSTEIPSLQEGLETVKLASSITGINRTLVAKTEVQAKASVVLTKKAETWVTLYNPMKTSYTLRKIKTDITNRNDGKPYKMGTIDYTLPSPITVKPGEQVRTDAWPVDVDANAIELLGLIGNGELSIDLQNNITTTVGDDPDNGYETYFYYYQDAVPCMLDITLLGLHLPNDEGYKEGENSTSTSPVQSAASSVGSSVASAGNDVKSAVSSTGAKATSALGGLL